MRLALADFGTLVGTCYVDLQNVSESDYAEIKAFFEPLINDSKIKSRVAIYSAFQFATTKCPAANPSDLWHHVIYRDYKRTKSGSNPEQSWVRTSGEAFELAIVQRYNPILEHYGLRLVSMISGNNKAKALKRMNLSGEIGSSKVDVIIEQRGRGLGIIDGYGIVGGLHAKTSLAERVSDDIPASRIMMKAGLLSVLSTLDVKSFPPPHGNLVNHGELGSPEKPSDKRKYIEEHGDFSVCISYNLRTVPSPNITVSGKKIYLGDMGTSEDDFTRFLLESLK
jgi:hypothetical protein